MKRPNPPGALAIFTALAACLACTGQPAPSGSPRGDRAAPTRAVEEPETQPTAPVEKTVTPELALAIRSHRCADGPPNPQRTRACALLEEFVAAGAVTSRPLREGLWRVGVALTAGRLDAPEGALVVGLRARGEVDGAPGRALALRAPSVSVEASAGAEQPSVVASAVHEGAERVRADLLGRTYGREGLSRVGARFADQLTSAIETAVDVDLPTDAYRFEDRGSDGWRLRGEQFPQCLLIRQRGDRLLGLWTSCGETGGDYSGAYVVELHPAPVFL